MSYHKSQTDLDLHLALSRLAEAARAATAAHTAEERHAVVRGLAEIVRRYDELEAVLTGATAEARDEPEFA